MKFIKISALLLACTFLSCNSVDFDSNRWRKWKESEEPAFLRWEMGKDLINNHHLIGKDTSEIKTLLGDPNNKWGEFWSYFLGHTGHGINTGTLFLKIDDGKVIDCSIGEG